MNNVIGCFSRDGLGPLVRIQGNMDAIQYRNIMENHMLPHARDKMSQNWVYQQDNDPKHTSKLLIGSLRRLLDGRRVRIPGWFSLNGIQLFKWPSNSPDLNPIEHLWSQVKSKLKGHRFASKDDLWAAVEQAWGEIPIENVISLVDSMPKRINSVIRSLGAHTKY